ncbi:MAG: hypothetical protein MK312_03320, partial [Roseibacillus sp.]|nr:hypothetical protein [Roseibacillus sp.]
MQSLKAAGSGAVPAVSELLSHGNSYVRARAIWLLPMLGGKGLEVVSSLLDGSTDAQQRLVDFRALPNDGETVEGLVSKLYRQEP